MFKNNKNILILLCSIIFIFLVFIFLISSSGAIYREKLSTTVNLNIENSTYTVVFNGNENTSGTTASKTCEYTVNCQLTPNGFIKAGYHFDGWATTANGAKAYDDKASVLNLALTGEYPLYARWEPNELVFNNQTITKSYDTSTQTIEVTQATNGTGEYTYTKTSEKNSSNIDTNYITLNGTTLTVSANTPAGTYTVVITVTDTNSGAVKSATYTITMEKSTPTVTLTEKTGMVYTGSEQVANTATVSPASDGTLTYTYYTDNACTVPYTPSLIANDILTRAQTAGQLNQIPGTDIYIFKGGTTNPPANYVKFNCSDPSDTSTCEDWRIIGIYNGQMKIIRVNSNGIPTAPPNFESIQWNTTDPNPGWANASLMTSLNTTYYNGLNQSVENMIDENGSWDVGPALREINAGDAYTQATTSGTKVGDTIHTTPWTGKVGLMASYEFLYATGGGDGCLTTSGYNYDKGCGTEANDWLLNTGSYLWTISPSSDYSTYILFVRSSGRVNYYNVGGTIAAVPAVFLKSDVKIIDGDGISPSTAYILTEPSLSPKIDAGNYSVKASVSETANYNSAESACVAHTIAKSDTTTTLEAITNTYNGTSQPASGAVSTLSSNNSTITNGEYTYTYYEGTSCDGIALAGAPTNAGVYRVKVTLTGTSNYNGSTSSCTVYTMNPKKATINLGTIPELTYGSDATMTYTYDGDGVVSCTSSDTTKVTCSVNTSTNEITITPISATDSDVTITISAGNGTNYSTADNKTATISGINKYEPTVILTEKTGMSWDNTPKNANQASVILINGENYSGDITYTYYTDSSCTIGGTTTAPTLAGNYYVKASIIAQGNYNSAESTCVAHNISTTTPTVTLTPKSASELIYTGSAIEANTATVLPNAGGEVTYTYYSDSSCTTPKVWAENLSYSNTKNGTDINCTDAQCAIDTLANIVLNNSSGTVIEKSNNLPKNVGTYYVKASVSGVQNKTTSAESSCVPHIITKRQVSVSDLSLSTSGIVSWTNSNYAEGYQISIDGINWTVVPAGVETTSYNYLNTITTTPGEKTIYVKAINSNTSNYEIVISTINTNVYTLTVNSNNASYGSLSPSSINVIDGVTFTTSSNVLTLSDGREIAATPTNVVGYTTVFDSWSSTSGTINTNATVTANFTRNANVYTITLENLDATTSGTTAIYEKYNTGYYLDSSATIQMTTSTNGITVPEKDGYTFQGYYTQTNGLGNQYIDENGKLTTAANSSNFTSNDTLYAYYIENSKTLYDVLKKAAKEGTYAKEYTGSHQDSIDSTKSTEKIYYWYGSDETNGTTILNKNNVVFANQCWQMIRTTDTGGVRMIYNGEAVNNQCLNTRETHIGYASRTSQNLSSNYWYGTDYTYDSINKVFSISGTTEQATWNASTGPGLVGKYTCKQTTETGTCATLYLVESYYNTTSGYVIPLNFDSHYSQFGTLQFNVNFTSPADVGYMYNTRYTFNPKTMTNNESMLSSASLATTYWYANSATWGRPTASKYNLDNPYQVSATTDYPNLVGEYTFRNTTQTYTNTSVYYIAAVNNTTMYYIQLTNTGNHTLAEFNYTYTYGDSYTDNGDGTYTINNPSIINRIDWYTGYSNVGANKYVCKNATNDTCSDLWYTTATSNTLMTYIKVVNDYKYAKGFTYKLDPDDNTYKYFLDDATEVSFWNINDSTNKTSLNNAHYTCWNATGKCTTLSYIYYLSGITPYYINLTGGKSVSDALDEMLTSNNVNTTNSTIKSGVDAWYKKYLYNDYDNYIDDTIYCNDRSIRALNGWNPDGGSLTAYLQFKEYLVGSDLSCTNTTDRFSVSNNNAKLTYKVGLMSSPEMNLLNQENMRKTGQHYWLASPHYVYSSAGGRNVNANGRWNNNNINYANGVRPAVSLIPGLEYSDGDGSMANPYIVDLSSVTP